MLHWSQSSPIGVLHVEASAAGVLHAVELDGECPEDGAPKPSVAAALDAYFAGDVDAIDHLAVGPVGSTPFRREVLTVLRQVPAGEVTSYGELARRVGRPRAARAVGQAVGANPIAVVVPCHRVIAGDG